MKGFLQLALAATAVIGTVAATQNTCDYRKGLKCPAGLNPCCGQFDVCGAGPYCLGGCNPRGSASPDDCAPAPSVVPATTNSTHPLACGDFAVENDVGVLKMGPTKARTGTVISSTSYVWYGNIKANIKTSRGAGVVTAFILYGNMKDEIDFEWVGAKLENTETNYYWSGVLNYENKIDFSGFQEGYNTYEKFHTYEVDWTEDRLNWLVDGKVVRTLNKKDTLNTTTGYYHYPQTPSRVQISIWPAGVEGGSKWTNEWAGGIVDWKNHPDIKKDGYYSALVKDVNIQCYDTPKNANITGSVKKSYMYSSMEGRAEDVVIGDWNTTLASSIATGREPEKGKKDLSKEELEKVETVPEVKPGTGGQGTGTGDSAPAPGATGGANSDFSQGAPATATGGAQKLALSGVAVVAAAVVAAFV
ncbi:Similar to Probable glycosidase CRH2; acc. no. P32623 [Pyronema omphalodes CBS 100304]|uniref:Similar to Probable glycosidase CRH2 acc. no. P32623 n=1 Tax=Pyronema omphalodes (strain CBS 100304) TaxID=1076935 RepID=U4LFQ7_PYROM|nr:Similar to Probable glycosidase CRH2; acc. no. P32623 [Pyronema omphalodes CBS 100304]